MDKFKEKESSKPSYLRPLNCFPEQRISKFVFPSLSVPSPWASPPVFDPKSSYADAFNARARSSIQMKNTGMKIIKNTNIFNSNGFENPITTNTKSKSLMKIAEFVTEESSIYGKKVSPLRINKTILFKPEHFQNASPSASHVRISQDNSTWITNNLTEKQAEKFNKGEYIPSMTQMQMYGRKDRPSKFESNMLWKQRNALEININKMI
jgi:hypothetical protein